MDLRPDTGPRRRLATRSGVVFARLLAAGLGLLFAATLFGSLWELSVRSRLSRTRPLSGRLVDIGGRRLHLDCRGQGAPTVVFESGLDAYGALSWQPVHDAVAQFTRSCAYSRAGMLWSDAAPGTVDAGTVAHDLHLLLTTAGERAPYLLVGHSLGGLYALAFAGRHPTQVIGLLLLDPTHPRQSEVLAPLVPALARPFPPSLQLLARLHWTGMPRLLLAMQPPASGPAAVLHRHAAPFMATALPAAAHEAEAIAASAVLAQEALDRRIPRTVVLSAGKAFPDAVRDQLGVDVATMRAVTQRVQSMHRELARRSPDGQHHVVPNAGHYVHHDTPAQVVQALQDLVRALRTPSPH